MALLLQIDQDIAVQAGTKQIACWAVFGVATLCGWFLGSASGTALLAVFRVMGWSTGLTLAISALSVARIAGCFWMACKSIHHGFHLVDTIACYKILARAQDRMIHLLTESEELKKQLRNVEDWDQDLRQAIEFRLSEVNKEVDSIINRAQAVLARLQVLANEDPQFFKGEK